MGYNSYSYKTQVDKCVDMITKGTPIAVIDLETTGRSPDKNYIFEFAGYKFCFDDKLNITMLDKTAILINSAEPINKKISELTGFTNDDLIGRPTENVVFPRIRSFLNGAILCSHNVTFEHGFVSAMYSRCGDYYLPVEKLDTLKMSRDLHKEEKSHKLGDIACRYGLDKDVKFHDARFDAAVCAKLLKIFITEYQDVNNDKENSKIKAEPIYINYWDGFRYDQKRIYITTKYGTVWWSVLNGQWGEKESGLIDLINMSYLEKRVLQYTKCNTFSELSKFKGKIKCC